MGNSEHLILLSDNTFTPRYGRILRNFIEAEYQHHDEEEQEACEMIVLSTSETYVHTPPSQTFMTI